MNLKELYIKTFKRQDAVIIKRVSESGRITSHWVVPSPSNVVQLNEIPEAITLHKDARYLSTKWNIPTYLMTYKTCEPIKLEELDRKSFYQADELHLILETDLAKKAYQSSEKSKVSDEIKLVLIVLIVGFIALGYYFNSQLALLQPDPVIDPNNPTPVVEVE